MSFNMYFIVAGIGFVVLSLIAINLKSNMTKYKKEAEFLRERLDGVMGRTAYYGSSVYGAVHTLHLVTEEKISITLKIGDMGQMCTIAAELGKEKTKELLLLLAAYMHDEITITYCNDYFEVRSDRGDVIFSASNNPKEEIAHTEESLNHAHNSENLHKLPTGPGAVDFMDDMYILQGQDVSCDLVEVKKVLNALSSELANIISTAEKEACTSLSMEQSAIVPLQFLHDVKKLMIQTRLLRSEAKRRLNQIAFDKVIIAPYLRDLEALNEQYIRSGILYITTADHCPHDRDATPNAYVFMEGQFTMLRDDQLETAFL